MVDNEELVLPTESSKVKLNEIVAKHLGCTEFTLVLTEGSKKGDNYIGIVYRAIATKNHKCTARDIGEKPETFSVVIKLAPQNEARRQHFFTKPCFDREMLFYDILTPVLRKFQETKGVCNGLVEVPECYGCIAVDKEEAIFLEDLRVAGFEMLNRHETDKITVAQVEKVMETLAKFHAVSYALKDQDFEQLKPFTKIQDIFSQRQNDVGIIAFTENAVKRAVGTLNPENAVDQMIVERLSKLFESGFFAVLLECITPDEYSTICHGDCWNNNILFKHSNGVPTDIKLLDYQMVRYASPATDIWYFLLVCTTKKFRDQHFDHLIRVYYDTLSQQIQSLGSDPEVVYPSAVFKEHVKKYAKFGMLMAIMLLPLFTAQAAEIPDLQELADKLQLNETTEDVQAKLTQADSLFNGRMVELLRDMAEREYL